MAPEGISSHITARIRVRVVAVEERVPLPEKGQNKRLLATIETRANPNHPSSRSCSSGLHNIFDRLKNRDPR